MSDQGKLDTIRGLLAKAEATPFVEEAETFRAKAAELIAKYDVDERLLKANQGQDRSAVVTKLIKVSQGYRKQQLTLVHRIASALGVYTVRVFSPEAHLARYAGGKPQRDAIELWGTQDTVDLVELLFTSLLIQVTNELQKVSIEDVPGWFRSHYRSNAGAVKSWRTDWYVGWADRVGDRLAEAHGAAVKEAANEGNVGAELVLVSELERFAAAAKAQHTKLVNRRTSYNPAALRAGQSAGERADIGLSRVGERRGVLTR